MRKRTTFVLSTILCGVTSTVLAAAEPTAEYDREQALQNMEASLDSAKSSLSQMGEALADVTVQAWNESQQSSAKSLSEVKEELVNNLAAAGEALAAQAASTAKSLSKKTTKYIEEQKAVAAEGDAIASLKLKLEHLTTMQSKFVQEVYDIKGEVLSSSRGSLALYRPQNFIMHTESPDEFMLYIRGEDVYYYDTAVNQLSIFDMRKMKENPFLLLTNQNDVIWSDFIVSQDEKRFTLVPKKKQDIKSVTVSFVPTAASEPTLLESITLRMSDGNTNFYRIVDPKVEVDPSVFTVDLPADVEIDDER